MKMKKKLCITISILLLLIGTIPFGAMGQQPKSGGTMRVHLEGDPPTLNPIFGTSVVTGWPCSQIFSSLVQYDLDLNPIPDLAESWDTSPDGLKYTFYLAKGVKWHDGEDFTSADVKFTFDTINEGFGAGRVLYAPIFESIETPDDNTVVINLKTPYAPLIMFLGNYWGSIIPKHLYEGTDILKNPHNFDNPVGTGPFKWVEWVKGDHITLEKNENYFKPGRPYLDQVIFKIIPSYPTALIAFEAGEIDFMPKFILYSELDRLQTIPEIEVIQHSQYWSGTWCLWFNFRRDITGDVNVRKAIAHAIDVELIGELVYYGWARPARAPMDYGGVSNWAYDPELYELFPKYDVAKANQLLDDAGYERGTDGVRFSLSIKTIMGAADLEKASEIIREQLKEVGIEITVEPLEIGTLIQEAMVDWEYDIAYINNGWGPDPTRSMFHYHSSNMKPGWLMNLAGYNNSRVDELYEQGLIEMDKAKRKEIYVEIQRILLEDQVAAYTVAVDQPNLHYIDFEGIPPGPWLAWDHYDNIWYNEAVTAVPELAILESTFFTVAAIMGILILGVTKAYWKKH